LVGNSGLLADAVIAMEGFMNLEPLYDHTRHSEGLRLKPYRCTANKLSIGYGTNIEEISLEEAEWLMQHRMNKAIAEVHKRWPFVEKMTDNRRLAIYDMAYNMGVPTFAEFKNTWAALEAGDYDKAARCAEDSKWYRQVGPRAVKIVSMIRNG
jgi:lysozyme